MVPIAFAIHLCGYELRLCKYVVVCSIIAHHLFNYLGVMSQAKMRMFLRSLQVL